MRYTTPEIEVLELEVVDVIQTSGAQGGNTVPDPSDDGLPYG